MSPSPGRSNADALFDEEDESFSDDVKNASAFASIGNANKEPAPVRTGTLALPNEPAPASVPQKGSRRPSKSAVKTPVSVPSKKLPAKGRGAQRYLVVCEADITHGDHVTTLRYVMSVNDVEAEVTHINAPGVVTRTVEVLPLTSENLVGLVNSLAPNIVHR